MSAAGAVQRAMPLRRRLAEAAVALAGAALVALAILADQAWFDRHFVRAFFIPRPVFQGVETSLRLLLAAAGLGAMLVLRPMVGRLAQRVPAAALAGQALRIAVALALAAGLGELGLRAVFSHAAEQGGQRAEPLRRADPRLGWVFAPARVGHASVGGRRIDYAFDPRGYRVASLAQPVDPNRPSIVFAGESILTGFGLRWDETIPARVGAALGLQSANLSVFGYADDQTHLRLAGELPRFSRPVAVVILFSPGLFFRDLDDDRPHLAAGLAWRPAARRWRLETLSRLFAAYHSDAEIARAIDLVHAELRADVDLASARGARALIVVPRLGPEDPIEQTLRRRILDDAALPAVEVEPDPRWRIPGDLHPDARGAQAIAAAIIGRLRQSGPTAKPAA